MCVMWLTLWHSLLQFSPANAQLMSKLSYMRKHYTYIIAMFHKSIIL